VLRNALGAAALLAAILAANAHAANITAPATEDTSVEQQNPNTNFGSGNDIVGGVRRGRCGSRAARSGGRC